MRINQKQIDALPAFTLEQVQKREKLQAQLDEAKALADQFNTSVENIRKLDGTETDRSPTDKVVVTCNEISEEQREQGVYSLFQEGNFLAEDVRVKEAQISKLEYEKTIYKSWTVSGPENDRRYFSSTIKKYPHEGLVHASYSFREIRVESSQGDVVYHIRGGEGLGNRSLNGIRAAGRAIGGFLAPLLSNLRIPKLVITQEE